MPQVELDILPHLNSVLGVQLTAVQQHFIHVLILKAWGDADTAEGITAIDRVDLPNALRIADLIVSAGALPELCRQQTSLAEHMPAPGSSYEGIFAAEHRLEGQMIQALQSARGTLTEVGVQEGAHLILDPLIPRERYARWLRQQTTTRPRRNDSPQRLSDSATSALDTLFAHLMVVIEQGLIHSFVHWHRGGKKLADAAWSMSGAAMMYSADITHHLALRHSAPSPASAVVAHSVPLPRAGPTSEDALKYDRAIAERCRDAAERAKSDLAGTEFEIICGDCAAYFEALSRWQPNLNHPEVSNPCRGFERVLREYVWKKAHTDRASA